ncbi:hypothetical protein EDB83DRAFT_2221577 [Lactarius deliciosus]|nr:hypothetical protein EDB83DRAFT_2221577 [Lactarius deliciosus]
MAQNSYSDGLCEQIIIATAYYIRAIGTAASFYALPHYWKQPYHTFALIGVGWVKELKYGHPDQIWTELGMHLHVFIALVVELCLCGLVDSRHVGLEKQVAIFLYMLQVCQFDMLQKDFSIQMKPYPSSLSCSCKASPI